MNNIDKQYTDLLQDILDNGVTKQDRTGTGTLSVFGRQIRHDMKTGFPLITTKRMAWKSIVTELLWFLRGDTNIKFLVDNDCNIWTGDVYKEYENSYAAWVGNSSWSNNGEPWDKENFIRLIKTDERFCKFFGELGPVYGKQWRDLGGRKTDSFYEFESNGYSEHIKGIDQIANLINDLKTNPDSRRLMVNAWNVGELEQMVLPPCHYGFQVYTRELSELERHDIKEQYGFDCRKLAKPSIKQLDDANIPIRAISLMFNMRSCDTFLGLPFNIASYGLLLEIIAKSVNMVPDELIGNLGDVHLYSNHIEQAKEQIGRELSAKERIELAGGKIQEKYPALIEKSLRVCDEREIPKHTREPFPLPTLNINTEFWPYEGGECGVGPLDAIKVFESFKDDNFCKCLLEEDIQLSNYQSHPAIKAPLSN